MNILYTFSATGNTLRVAQLIAQEQREAQIVPFRSVAEHPQADSVGFLFPIFAGGMPRLVRQFLQDFPARADVYYYAVSTCGALGGYAMDTVRELLEAKGASLAYARSIRSVRNYIALYNPPKAESCAALLSRADEQAKAAGREIAAGVRRRVSRSRFDPQRLVKLAPYDVDREFSVSDACIHCALCAQVCPAENIDMIGGKPHWLHRCESCMACIHWCPVRAIDMGDKTKKRNRYHHPAISAQEVNR